MQINIYLVKEKLVKTTVMNFLKTYKNLYRIYKIKTIKINVKAKNLFRTIDKCIYTYVTYDLTYYMLYLM